MKLAIRLDVSTFIGTGHLKRMLAVAGALRRPGGAVQFVCRQMDLDVSKMVSREGFEAIVLPPPAQPFKPDRTIPHSAWAHVTQEQDAAETIAALAGDPPDAVAVDHYAFDARWHRAVRDGLARPLMVIDDLGDRRLEGEWLVDHNFHPDHQAKYRGLLAPGMAILTGPTYAMLDPAYADAPRYAFSERARSIGVFMGGVDVRGDSIRVLDAIETIGWRGPVEVVSTSANPALGRLSAAVLARPGIELSRDLPDLAAFFARHDLQIGAGGGAIWERCCIGPPSICLVCGENQRLSVPFLDAAGIVVGYDMLGEAAGGEPALAATIDALLGDPERRRALHKSGMALVDGRGAERIAATLAAS